MSPTELLRSLNFAERCSRENQLQNLEAKEGTFSSVWSPSSSFMKWLSNHESLYWISGKPGSGKSTLVNYLIDKDRTKRKLQEYSQMDWIVLRFFFDFRGGKGVTNSFEGLLRSLIYQLVKEIPQIRVLDFDDKEHGVSSTWQEHRLRDALRTAIQKVEGGVCIFVDGLDEYEGKILELIQFLRRLTSSIENRKTLIKLCVSSRPEPIPFQLLQDLPTFDISSHNKSGIRSYCSLTLKELEPIALEGLDISRLSHTIAERAEGVFLWARFALNELIQGHFSGESFEEASVRLESIPSDLETLYDRMLNRMRPLEQKECMVMLQLVCFAQEELSWQDHLVATEFAMGKDLVIKSAGHFQDLSDTPQSYSTYTKRLRAKAVGFLEIVESKQEERYPRPRLIHKSVSTYLQQKGWQILGDLDTYNLATHESFYIETCIRYLRQFIRHCELKNIPIPSDSSDRLLDEETVQNFRETWPLFNYARQFLFHHARSLECCGVSSYPLLHGFLTRQIVYLHRPARFLGPLNFCLPCNVICEVLDEGFEVTHMAFLHGLALFCKDDLSSKIVAPGPNFWKLALSCAILSSRVGNYDISATQELLSLALQKVNFVEQVHIECLFEDWRIGPRPDVVEWVLRHESVRDLQLTDKRGQKVTLLWYFTRLHFDSSDHTTRFLSIVIEVSNSRGEDVRQRCGPEGNLVETLLEQYPGDFRRKKLKAVREYYESKSWPFEYDADEINREYSQDWFSATDTSL